MLEASGLSSVILILRGCFLCCVGVCVCLLSRDYDSRDLTHSGKKCVKELNKQKAQDD